MNAHRIALARLTLPSLVPIVAIVTLVPLACSSSDASSSTPSNEADATADALTRSNSDAAVGNEDVDANASDAAPESSTSNSDAAGDANDSDAGADASGVCTYGDPNACPVGQYCNAPNCHTGTCAPLLKEAGPKSPVCGCDGTTYWNASEAGFHGMSIAHYSQCATGVACGGAANTQCAAGQACNIMLASSADCATPNPSGQCWVMPATCPLTIGAGTSTSCDNAVLCNTWCGVIMHGSAWYNDTTCPL
jgi:hypothetical protein